MRYLSLGILERAILVKLFVYYQESSGMLRSSKVAETFGGSVSAKRVELAAEALDDGGLIYTSFSQSGTGYEIKRKGYLHIEKLLREPYSFETTYKLHGDSWLLDADLSDFENEIPASDRIVPIDDNQRQEVKQRLDEAAEAIQGSNSLDPDERELIQDHLEAGKDLIEKPNVLLGAFDSLILSPLKRAYEKIAEEGLRAILLGVIEAIKSLF